MHKSELASPSSTEQSKLKLALQDVSFPKVTSQSVLFSAAAKSELAETSSVSPQLVAQFLYLIL